MEDIILADTSIHLLPEKAIWWAEKKTLLLADLHIGKAGHFRKHGISLSGNIHLTDLKILQKLIRSLSCQRVIFLGDLFHSDVNKEVVDFIECLHQFTSVKFQLVPGNHDRWSQGVDLGKIELLRETEEESNFIFTHEPLEKNDIPPGKYNLSGHIHPAISLRGKGGQFMRLPCYWFQKKQGILPSFGKLTGAAQIKPSRTDQIFVCTENKVIKV